ncbi:restriction endonuclease [Candidatus Merdisoma sp. HCP28S3_D10]|uniref:restriction endonuclease n=1 Tax=unclassified Candidatus Merdisoma TaxID=3099611 RepID=UPI003F8B8062
MRLFYYLIAAPALFLLRVLFWPFRTVLRCAGWLHRWRKERRRFRRADYDDMDGWEFEEYVGELLVKDGYIHVEVTRGSGDQGVDVLAERDGVSYAIQCKHYQAKISNKAVQEAYAGAEFYGCDVPVVVTNSYFTPSAEELADEIGVELWDREELNRMVKKSTKSRKNNRKNRRMA